MASRPRDWCAKCGQIAKGKADKITDGKLDLPKPTAKKASARKSTRAKPTSRKAPAKPTTKKVS